MQRKKLLWQLYPAFLAITLISLVFFSWYGFHYLYLFHLEQTQQDLEEKAFLIKPQIYQYILDGNATKIHEFCHSFGTISNTRFTVITPDGEVLGESHMDRQLLGNLSNRPEVADALTKSVVMVERYSYTLNQEMVYVAIPVVHQGKVQAVIRTAQSTYVINESLYQLGIHALIELLLISILTSVVSFWVVRRSSRPLEVIQAGADQFAQGNLNQRLPLLGSVEMADVAKSLNKMAVLLNERIQTILEQRNEQEAVLSSMIEGVFAVNEEGLLITMNQAAAELFDTAPPQGVGKHLREVIRDITLQQFVNKALMTPGLLEEEITLSYHDEPRHLKATGTLLENASGKNIGALIVLNDITRLRRLESIRKDFVANVSHELKTPIAAIKGAVETLLDGASEDPETSRRFLKMIARNSERLGAIIEDLLTLSRLEQGQSDVQIELTKQQVLDTLQAAVLTCEIKARDKQIKLEIECAEDLMACFNAPLMEQAIVNLVDNAIRYSAEGDTIHILAYAKDETFHVDVRDYGLGIAEEHLSRLFERFYRVDKARSRKMGETGLGLAIVKHIATVHEGSIQVQSTVGKGSTFSLIFPKK